MYLSQWKTPGASGIQCCGVAEGLRTSGADCYHDGALTAIPHQRRLPGYYPWADSSIEELRSDHQDSHPLIALYGQCESLMKGGV